MSEDRQVIIPRYKMIITYDIRPGNRDQYYQFVMGELVPAMQSMGVYMTEAWHTAYGSYPIRMVTFVAEDMETLQDMLESSEWTELETKLKMFIENYTMRIVEYRQGFQL